LNNDIIGNSCSSDGVCNDKQVRIFSEGPRWQGHENWPARSAASAARMTPVAQHLALPRRAGGAQPSLGIDVMQVWRNDRFGRGGDHTEFLNLGFPAVRFSVAIENYNWQHQDLRTENGIKYGDLIENMDFPYLARGHEIERRRACLAGQRPAAARTDCRGGSEHGYDGEVGGPLGSSLCGSLA
jgi:hypothetical protein